MRSSGAFHFLFDPLRASALVEVPPRP